MLDMAFFENAYADKAPPWDIGRVQRAFTELTNDGLVTGDVLDAGCGTGDNALWFAERGLNVTGVDLIARAVDAAKTKAKERGIAASFIVEDALHLERLGRTFNSVIDSGLFHVFSDKLRAEYVASLGRVTERGSRLFLLCFSEAVPGTEGPRRVSRKDLEAAFSDGWVLEELRPTQFEAILEKPTSVPAWLAVLRRT